MASAGVGSPVSGPEGPLAGAHLTPRFLWLLGSSAGLGPAQSPTPAAHFLDSAAANAPLAPAPSLPKPCPPTPGTRIQQVLGHPGLMGQQGTIPALSVNWGVGRAPLLLFIPSTHSHFSRKTRKAGSPPHPTPWFPDLLKDRLPGVWLLPAAPHLKGAGPRGSWAWLRGAARAPPQDAFPSTPLTGCLAGWGCSPVPPTPRHPIPSRS